MQRVLSPYEKNQLRQFGKTEADLLAAGEMPVEYFTGKVEFAGHVFSVDQRALIPRVETEELVDLAVQQLVTLAEKTQRPLVVADIGCGCGAIGISVYLQAQKLGIPVDLYLSDISSAALKVARKNVADLASANKNIHILKSDLLAAYPKKLQFDLIIANLPYIPSSRIATLESSVKNFEPHVALDGGTDGLKYMHRLLAAAQGRLANNGIILLEIDYTHTLAEILSPVTYLEGKIVQDSFERSRFAVLFPLASRSRL